MFCKQRLYRRLTLSSALSSGRKISDACATASGNCGGGGKDGVMDMETTIENLDDIKNKDDIFKLESSGFKLNGNNRERLFMRTQDARKPKFIPRRPVEFLRDSPVSLRNYHL